PSAAGAAPSTEASHREPELALKLAKENPCVASSRHMDGDSGLRLLHGGYVFLRRLYVLFFLELASQRIPFTACSEHPGGAWAAQQARNLVCQLKEAEVRPRFLIHDRDSNVPSAFDAVFRAEALEVIPTPVRAPNANARCERWVSSVRRECLDWL